MATSEDPAATTPPPPPQPPTAPTTPLAQYPFRLLNDEHVLGTYPVTSVERSLGKLVSVIFVTNTRVVYAAEAKSVFSGSSSQVKEYKIAAIDGVAAGRHKGLDALGIGIAVALAINLLIFVVLGTAMMALVNNIPFGIGSGLVAGSGAGVLITAVAISSIISGIVTVIVLARARGYVTILGNLAETSIAPRHDWITIAITAFLFLLFGPLIGIALVAIVIMRGLGAFRAGDAFAYADPANLDAIGYGMGALILEAQAQSRIASA